VARASVRAAPEGLRSLRSHLRTVPSEAPAAREFLLRQAGLVPGRRHKRVIASKAVSRVPGAGLRLRIVEGGLNNQSMALNRSGFDEY
jgi:hypothetical protein